MSLEQASFLAEIISAIAVVASLVFVGVQLRQATKAVRASTSQAHSATYHAIIETIIENADFARIWREGLADFDKLNADERVRFVALTSALFRFYESSQVQWSRGQLDDEHWITIERQASSLASQPGIQAWWELRRTWHSERFQRWFEAIQPAEVHALYGLFGRPARTGSAEQPLPIVARLD